MINLLPPEQKKEISLRERYNLIFILGIVSLSFLFSLSLILLSVKYSLSGDLKCQKTYLKQIDKELSIQNNLRERIKNYNQLLPKLNSFYHNQPHITEVLEEISALVPPETYLTNLNIRPANKGKVFLVSLSGFCPDRETLLSFKEALGREGRFYDVYFPPVDWIKPENISFNAGFKIK